MERKCLRCGGDMIECAVRPEGCAYGLMAAKNIGPFEGKSELLRAAVCPKCGEVSVFVEKTDIFKK